MVKFEGPLSKYDLTKVVNDWTVREPNIRDDDLVVFLDDTGKVNLSTQNSVFGLGGIAVIGADYGPSVVEPWQDLKRGIFGLDNNTPFHATRHLKAAKEHELRPLIQFFQQSVFKRIGGAITLRSQIHGDMRDAVLAASSPISIKLMELMKRRVVNRDDWYLEHSSDLSRWVVQAMMSRGENHFRYGDSKSSGGPWFLVKKHEPGLEIADLLMYLSGLRLREAPNFVPAYLEIMNAAFDDVNGHLGITEICGPEVWFGADGKQIAAPTISVVRATYGRPDRKKRPKIGR